MMHVVSCRNAYIYQITANSAKLTAAASSVLQPPYSTHCHTLSCYTLHCYITLLAHGKHWMLLHTVPSLRVVSIYFVAKLHCFNVNYQCRSSRKKLIVLYTQDNKNFQPLKGDISVSSLPYSTQAAVCSANYSKLI